MFSKPSYCQNLFVHMPHHNRLDVAIADTVLLAGDNLTWNNKEQESKRLLGGVLSYFCWGKFGNLEGGESINEFYEDHNSHLFCLLLKVF